MKNFILFFFLVIAFHSFSQYDRMPEKDKKSVIDPFILSMLNDINADSIGNTIQTLQNFDTRFMLSPNRKEIAEWIQNKYISIGYSNTIIDSFMVQKTWNGNTYNLYQYNVIATQTGTLNPDLIYIVGGHYDSYALGDPMLSAPGADDNASGTAAAIEVARVMKKNNYQPASTIQFVAFAAEELMMSPGGCGSMDFSEKAAAANQKIQFMINNDMISHATTTGGWVVNLKRYDNSEWLSKLASHVIVDYTTLSIINNPEMNGWSDSRPFYDAGFNAVYFEEAQFSPYYHQVSDIMSNYNLPYCAEITKISCALLTEAIERPVLKKLDLTPVNGKIKISWNTQSDLNVTGYNLYRSLSPGNNFLKINTDIIQDTLYIDSLVNPLTWYYYQVVSINNLNEESYVTLVDSVVVPTFDQGVLIIDDSQNEFLAPADSVVDNFYGSLFSDFTFMHFDAASNSSGINLGLLGQYEVVMWHTDKYSSSSKFYSSTNEIEKYIKYGGKLIFTTDRFVLTTDHNQAQHDTYYPGSFLYDVFHIDSIFKTTTSRFWGAKSNNSEYPELNIDTLKTLTSNMHHLSNVESLFNTEGNIIYSYNTKYDSLSSSGNMKGLPVGIENINNPGKYILLSFPLWYINYNEAKTFIDFVMNEKFVDTSSISVPTIKFENISLSCAPNPANRNFLLSFTIPECSYVNIELYSMGGVLISSVMHKMVNAGRNSVFINTDNFPSGVYYCVVRNNKFFETGKIVIIK